MGGGGGVLDSGREGTPWWGVLDRRWPASQTEARPGGGGARRRYCCARRAAAAAAAGGRWRRRRRRRRAVAAGPTGGGVSGGRVGRGGGGPSCRAPPAAVAGTAARRRRRGGGAVASRQRAHLPSLPDAVRPRHCAASDNTVEGGPWPATACPLCPRKGTAAEVCTWQTGTRRAEKEKKSWAPPTHDTWKKKEKSKNKKKRGGGTGVVVGRYRERGR